MIKYVSDVLVVVADNAGPVLDINVWVVVVDGRRWLFS